MGCAQEKINKKTSKPQNEQKKTPNLLGNN